MRPSCHASSSVGVVGGVVVRHRPQALLEVAPGGVGPVPEHVGVELAPGQLGRERGRALGPRVRQRRQVGQQGARVDLAVLQRRREHRGAGQVRPVTALGVVLDALVEERVPALERGRLAGGRQVGHAVAGLGQVLGVHPADPAQVARDGGRTGPAVRAPGAGERGEHLVRRAAAGGQRARAHGVRRAGGLQRDALAAQRLADPLVAAPAERRGLGADVDAGRADLAGQPGQHLGRVPCRMTSAPSYCSDRAAQGGGEPGPPRRTGRRPERGVEDEERQDRPAGGGLVGRDERRVVGQSQVTPQPEDGVGHR